MATFLVKSLYTYWDRSNSFGDAGFDVDTFPEIAETGESLSQIFFGFALPKKSK